MTRIAICALAFAAMAAGANVPKDLSNVRGVNYASSSVKGHTLTWTQYNAAEVERDLGYAQRLNFNQVRVFITYEAWTADKEAFRKNLVHFVRAAHQRGMGVMPTIGSIGDLRACTLAGVADRERYAIHAGLQPADGCSRKPSRR